MSQRGIPFKALYRCPTLRMTLANTLGAAAAQMTPFSHPLVSPPHRTRRATSEQDPNVAARPRRAVPPELRHAPISVPTPMLSLRWGFESSRNGISTSRRYVSLTSSAKLHCKRASKKLVRPPRQTALQPPPYRAMAAAQPSDTTARPDRDQRDPLCPLQWQGEQRCRGAPSSSSCGSAHAAAGDTDSQTPRVAFFRHYTGSE